MIRMTGPIACPDDTICCYEDFHYVGPQEKLTPANACQGLTRIPVARSVYNNTDGMVKVYQNHECEGTVVTTIEPGSGKRMIEPPIRSVKFVSLMS